MKKLGSWLWRILECNGWAMNALYTVPMPPAYWEAHPTNPYRVTTTTDLDYFTGPHELADYWTTHPPNYYERAMNDDCEPT